MLYSLKTVKITLLHMWKQYSTSRFRAPNITVSVTNRVWTHNFEVTSILHTADKGSQTGGHQTADTRPLTPDCWHQTADTRLLTPDRWHQTADTRLLIPHRWHLFCFVKCLQCVRKFWLSLVKFITKIECFRLLVLLNFVTKFWGKIVAKRIKITAL